MTAEIERKIQIQLRAMERTVQDKDLLLTDNIEWKGRKTDIRETYAQFWIIDV